MPQINMALLIDELPSHLFIYLPLFCSLFEEMPFKYNQSNTKYSNTICRGNMFRKIL